MMKITRNNKTYRDIEAFEDYELTQCCIYEMAARSSWYEEQLQDIINLYTEYKQETEHEFKVPSTSSILLGKILNLGIHTYVYPSDKSQEVYKIYSIIREKYPTDHSKSQTHITRVAEEERTYIHRYIVSNGFTIDNTFEIDEWLLENHIDVGFYRGDTPSKAKEMLNELITTNKILKTNLKTNITPDFSRPTLSFNTFEARTASVQLDFSLSKHELLSYVSHIKDELDTQEKPILSPVELLNAELSEIFTPDQLNHKEGHKQVTLATMFYIYDAFNTGMKQSEIKREVSNYNNANIDERTIKKYRNLMIDFIDKEKFKQITSSILL